MRPQDEYVPLYPLLADYWDKSLTKLPTKLRKRLGIFEVLWKKLKPEGRRALVSQIDYQKDPKNSEERQYYWDLVGKKSAIEREIGKYELMHHHNIPSEAKLQGERLSELRANLAEIEQLLELPPAALKQAATDDARYVNSKANNKPPGKMPRTEVGQLTVEAAWEIECESGERTTADIVMNRLQMWANAKPNNHPALVKSIPYGVVWATKKERKEKNYMIDHCGTHLTEWYKSRISGVSR